MDDASYQIVVAGARPATVRSLEALVQTRSAELGLPAGAITVLDVATGATRNARLPTFAVVFGGENVAVDPALLRSLIEDSIEIAPLASAANQVSAEVPPLLRHLNVLFNGTPGNVPERLASLIFESFRLLRPQRKAFISYKRDDSQDLADKVYDGLDKRGFDVFIDVRSVPPAVDVQATLWHRLSDSDVVVLIDTPNFRASRWTTEELARANATNIQILHLLFPGQIEDSTSAFSHFFPLTASDFAEGDIKQGGSVTPDCVDRICAAAEGLRARAIAARHRYLVDNFCDAARDLGASPVVQPERWISLKRKDGTHLAVIPAIGIPTADRINELHSAIEAVSPGPDEMWVVYDSRGILDTWITHLDWLDEHLPIRTIKMSGAVPLLTAALS
jgi:hypothetical protein